MEPRLCALRRVGLAVDIVASCFRTQSSDTQESRPTNDTLDSTAFVEKEKDGILTVSDVEDVVQLS